MIRKTKNGQRSISNRNEQYKDDEEVERLQAI